MPASRTDPRERSVRRMTNSDEDERMEGPLVCSVEEAARLLGISRSKAYQYVRDSRLRTIPVGRRHVVSAAAIRALLWTSLNGPSRSRSSHVDQDVNRIEVVGRLTRDAECRTAKSDRLVCGLRLAIRRGHGDDAVFIDVVSFGDTAEYASELRKGQLVWVGGRLDQREWTADDGKRRSAHQIIAQHIEERENPRAKTA